MKKLFSYFLSAIMLFAVSCAEEYDDSLIWDKLNSLENRVAALEQLCRQMNTNISSLQTVVEALQNNDYVTNVAPITEDGEVIGYTITFSKSGTITIYHGKDGKDGQNGADGKDGTDGYTPVIGIAKDTDGEYYWTLDGDWLLDKDGNKIKAEGKDGQNGTNGADGSDGQNGADGITPKLKIEGGYWYISYDNGTTWTELGKATGEDGKDGQNGADGKDGDSMFKDVAYDDNYVYITLIDGSVIVIPRQQIPNNEIWYTTSDGKLVTSYKTNAFGANVISNEYKYGIGVMTFDADVTMIGNGAFASCTNLTNITIPTCVTKIGNLAFNNCPGLTTIHIPESVTEIEGNPFVFCENLKNISGKFASQDGRCLIFNGELKSFAPADLSEYTLPNNVTKIGDNAFNGYIKLTTVTIPDSVIAIGSWAFSSCNGLINITLPDSVTEIGAACFERCCALESITLSNSLSHIPFWAFHECTSLKSITIPDSVKTMGILNSNTGECTIHNPFVGCSNLEAFYGKLASDDNKHIIIDNTFVALAPAGITEYSIPEGVTTMHHDALTGGKNAGLVLNKFTLPSTISAFQIISGTYYIQKITDLYCKALTPPGGLDLTFEVEHIYVPTESVNAYKTAKGWKTHADKIVGYNFE